MKYWRSVFIALSGLVLASCGEAGEAPSPGAGAQTGNIVLATTRNMPDWLLVARQRSCAPDENCPRGEVHFNQRTITRNADGTADIWIQVRHGSGQLFRVDTETTETTIRYELERLHYRFQCDSGEFIVVERQFMGANETVVARDEPRQIYRRPVRGSVTGVIFPIACRGA